MKKLIAILVTALLLMGCSFQQSELDKELSALMDIKEIEFKYDKGSFLGQVIDVKGDGVYLSDWLDDNNFVKHGVKRIQGDTHEVLLDVSEEFLGVDSFVQLEGKLFYSTYTLGAVAPGKKDDTGGVAYKIRVQENGESKDVLDFDDKKIVNPPELFVMNKQAFAIMQLEAADSLEVVIFNLSTNEVTFSESDKELSIHSDFILWETTQGLETDKLVFAMTHDRNGEIDSTIYTFDGETVKQNVYKGLYIYDVTLIQGQYMFAYNENSDDLRYIGYLNADEDLIKTEIGVSNILKVMDVKDGAIISARIGDEGDEMYHYVEIEGMDVRFESTSILGKDFNKYRVSDGFVAIDNDRDGITIVKYFKSK